MNRLLWACLSTALLLGGNTARAGAILISGSAASNDIGYTPRQGGGIALNYYSTSKSQSVGSATPNSATASTLDSQSTLPGGSISASGTATLTLSPSASSFDTLTGPASSTSSASVANTVSTDSTTENYTENSGSFTISTPYAFTLSVPFTATALASAASAPDGTSDGHCEGYGAYDLHSSDYSTNINGHNDVYDTASSTLSTSGYHYVNGSYTTGYNPSVVVSGVLQPGTYYFESYTAAYNDVFGDSASGSASSSQGYTLTLTPAATPEPASLTLLGLGGLGLAGYGWRRRRLAVTA